MIKIIKFTFLISISAFKINSKLSKKDGKLLSIFVARLGVKRVLATTAAREVEWIGNALNSSYLSSIYYYT